VNELPKRLKIDMSYGNKNKIKTEHGGAKNGGGYWGTREDAKVASRKLRRRYHKSEILQQAVPGKIKEVKGPENEGVSIFQSK
jgi:hypothetical protein